MQFPNKISVLLASKLNYYDIFQLKNSSNRSKL